MTAKSIIIWILILMYLTPLTGSGQNTDQANRTKIIPAVKGEKTSTILSDMGVASSFALFSSNGSISNSGTTLISGDIGTNAGIISGFEGSDEKGIIYPIPAEIVTRCLTDLQKLYHSLNSLPVNVELRTPPQFGHNLVLTPRTYLLNGATTLTDTLYINALNDRNSLFYIQINGALTTAAKSKVILMNGARSKNIFWKIEGSVTLGCNSTFRGIIVANNGAITLKTGVLLDGAAFTTAGSISIFSSTVISPSEHATKRIESIHPENPEVDLIIASNPFGSYTTINLKNDSKYQNCTFKIYDKTGVVVLNSAVSKQVITLDTNRLHDEVYFYQLTDKSKIIQSGKLISQN